MPLFLMDDDGTYQPARTDSDASLVILTGELHPDEVTAETGIHADRWWLQGEYESHPPNGVHRSRPYANSGWVIESRLDGTASAEEHLADLLDRINGQLEILAAYSSNGRVKQVRLWIRHHTDNENPGFSLRNELLQRVVALGAGLEIDVYMDLGDPDARPDIPVPPRVKLPGR